ncbi:minor histocompatibility antigen H13 isoform X3 [Oreochromis niloticus]|uniref:minor histocompatibility antigen H13 isoform X3 n=1 Tax=Oreochromis niloticus TaxID=8128 RepID=UPI000674B656|nr:minor histocompatibility antigen H13 isoform X3 [Oreochromis niloticus]XP_031606062.1 minor histocompatibility antigen H13 isoform X3 [Oreochromis aureus]
MSEAEQVPASAPEAAASAVLDALNATDSNGTEALNATAKFVATPEGTALAYGSLVFMALLPIFFGALRSVTCSKSKNAADMPETITSRDAARFPIIASCTLFGLYLFFKVFSQEYINLLLSVYFFVLGVLALSHTMSPLMSRIFPASFPNKQYQLLFTQGSGESKEEIVNYEFDTKNLVCLLISSVVGVWYLLKKHWIANNLFGLAFALNGVELLHLNNVSTGCILLGGLFIYDVFWVFGTNVMVTVAKSFEAPIKLVFPQDLLEKGLEASNFAMLGLGDIVIPGIFIALLLRFDVSLNKNSRTYFYSSFLAYIFGLGLTIFVMHTFKHAQPALLYLVPACVGFPVIIALFKGELTEMFSYESSEEVLPASPRLTSFPTVSGSPASLASSMDAVSVATGSSPRHRRLQPTSM